MSTPQTPANSRTPLIVSTIITILFILSGTVLVTVGTSVAFGLPIGLVVLGFLLVVYAFIIGFRI